MVADIEELETMDASEIYLKKKKTQCKEGNNSTQNGKFIFPVAEGRINFFGGDQELRTSTLTRDHPIRGERQRDFLGESEGSLPQTQDSLPDAGEARNDFWWPGGWGPQGKPKTDGGGLARVPHLRVCKHLFISGWRTQGGRDELTSRRGTVQLAWQKPPVRRKGGRAGLPKRC